MLRYLFGVGDLEMLDDESIAGFDGGLFHHSYPIHR